MLSPKQETAFKSINNALASLNYEIKSPADERIQDILEDICGILEEMLSDDTHN